MPIQVYIALLRGINVSGQKLIKMENLRAAFTASGFHSVKTYIQSGNVIFTSEVADMQLLTLKIEKLIEDNFGFSTDVILRSMGDFESIVNDENFQKMKSNDEAKYYIVLTRSMEIADIQLPAFSKNNDVEIMQLGPGFAFCKATQFKGAFGFPNALLEKLTSAPATTRNPQTMQKLLELCSSLT